MFTRGRTGSVVAPMRRRSYRGPLATEVTGLWSLLERIRPIPAGQRKRLALPGVDVPEAHEPLVYYAGDIGLVERRCVAVVGARKVSPEGAARARRVARELVAAGVVVVSGLAEGVDTNAHEAAIQADGRTIAVIGTPLESAYPARNGPLQERIYRDHLLVSPFAAGTRVFPSNFPQRNKVMAALTDATVIIEASDTSGSLHQAAECMPGRLNRWLFIARSVVDDPSLTWPRKFLGHPNVRILEKTEDILAVV